MNTLQKGTLSPESNKQALDAAQTADSVTPGLEVTPENAAIKTRLRRNISPATVKVYVRHSTDCPIKSDKYSRDCECPKWIYENYNGKDRRYSAGTRSWNKAERIRQEVEDSYDPVKAELKSLKQSEQAKRTPISDAVERYLSDVAARHLASSTQKNCRLTVRKRLLPWCEQNGLYTLDELNVSQLTKWRSTWTLSSGASQGQQERVVTFFEFCVRQGFLERNPARLLSRIQLKRKPTDYFTREEFEKLVASSSHFVRSWGCKNGKKSIWPTLMPRMVLLMRWSGLRISDAVNLERSRLFGDKILLYQQKTGEPVYVPLPHEVAESLRETPPLESATDPRYFFRSSETRNWVGLWERAFKALFQIAEIRNVDGTPKRCHAHMLRDSFAIENLLAGVPIDQVSILLGHASIKTTERHYAPWVRARQQQLEESVMKAHAVLGITKRAASAVPATRRDQKQDLQRTARKKAHCSRSTAVDPKRSAAAKRAWVTMRAKHKAGTIGRLKPRAA